MFRYFILILLPAVFSFAAKGQSRDTPGKVNNIYVGLGGIYTDYQDDKFSRVIYSGTGGRFEFGFNKEKTDKYFWETGFTGDYSKEKASTHNMADTKVFNIDLYFKYMRNLNGHFYLGGRVDLTDINYRIDPGLGNNAAASVTSTHLSLSAMCKRQVFNKNWKFNAVMDLSLVSYQKDIPSFVTSYSQKRIEEGKIDYYDEMAGGLGYNYGEFKFLWNNFNIRTRFYMHFKKRFVFGYTWQMRKFSVVDDYPTTIGTHCLIVRYNIFHKEKQLNQ